MVGRIANESSGSIESRLPDMATLQEIGNEVKQLTRAEQEALHFYDLPRHVQVLVQRKIDALGSQLALFPHYRMSGGDKYRLRIGDCRVIYRFDLAKGEIYLLAIGHRREIYRDKT